jgi:plastocyanin
MSSKIISLLALLLWCLTPAWAADHQVSVGVGGLMFSPMSLTINAGDTVTFVSNTSTPHNVHSAASDSQQFDCAKGCTGDGKGGNGAVAAGPWSATVAFPNAGTFGYQCDLHVSSGMTGVITVQAAAPAADFGLSAQASSVSVVQGASVDNTITISPLNGFTGSPALTASGLPSGASTTFRSSSATSSVVTLATSAATPVGTSTVTVTGTAGSLTHTATFNLAVGAATPPPPAFSIQPGTTGLWYNTTQSGQGFDIEVIDSTSMLAVWYVFDAAGNPLWLTAIGNYSGDTATLDVHSAAGGFFPPNFDQTKITRPHWGSFNFTFSDCNHGNVTWTPDAGLAGFSAGSLPITRLTLPSGLSCP